MSTFSVFFIASKQVRHLFIVNFEIAVTKNTLFPKMLSSLTRSFCQISVYNGLLQFFPTLNIMKLQNYRYNNVFPKILVLLVMVLNKTYHFYYLLRCYLFQIIQINIRSSNLIACYRKIRAPKARNGKHT